VRRDAAQRGRPILQGQTINWIIDLGPGAGHDGGRIVFEGQPADLVVARSTVTGEHLAAFVDRPKGVASR
jgi:hypothetical protein